MYPKALTFAAMDTTAGALGRILFILSIHQDVQNKLHQEIREAKKSGDLSYDELVALPYLDAVRRETLRVYAMRYFPLLSQLNRNWNPGIHLSLLYPECKVACISFPEFVIHWWITELARHCSSSVYSHHWIRWSGNDQDSHSEQYEYYHFDISQPRNLGTRLIWLEAWEMV